MACESHKQATALKKYQAAEKAHEAVNDEEAHTEPKEAGRALIPFHKHATRSWVTRCQAMGGRVMAGEVANDPDTRDRNRPMPPIPRSHRTPRHRPET